MKVIIEGTAEEIAAIVRAVLGVPDHDDAAERAGDDLLEEAGFEL